MYGQPISSPPPLPPLHQQVSAELRRRIFGGTLPIGESLPSEAQLVEEFGASRGTVRQALATLRAEGLIGGGQGRPPVVRSAVASQPFSTFLSFTSWARQIGREPGQRTIEVARRRAAGEVAVALEVEEGSPVVELLRLRLLDGRPVMVERASFVEPVGRLLFDFDPDSGSIYAHLIASGVDLSVGRHTIDAVAASSVDASLLDAAVGTPLLRERRVAGSGDGSVLEYGDDRYRPDVVSFTIENAMDGLRSARWHRAAAAGAP